MAVAPAGWWVCWLGVRLRGACPAPLSSGKACVGGSCRGAKVGAWALSRTRVRVPVWRWGLRSVSLPPSLPRGPASLPTRARSPSLSPLAGSKSLVDLLPSSSTCPRESVTDACPPLGLSSSSASRRGSAAVRSPAAPRWRGLPPARSRSSDPARGGRGWFPRLPDVAPRLPVCMGVGPLRPRPPVRPGRIRRRGRARRGPWWRVPRVGSVSPSRRLGTGVSLGSDGWPSRFCPRCPPPVRPAPPTALRVFCRSRGSTVAGRFSLRLPLRSSSRLPRARYGRRVPALPGAAVGDPGGEERGEGGRGCRRGGGVGEGGGVGRGTGAAVAVLSRATGCLCARADGCRNPRSGGFPAALSSRSLVPARPRSRPRLARSVPRTPLLACAPYPLSRALSPASRRVSASLALLTWLILPVAYACLKD